jgi:hypothetical protein
MKRTVCTLYLEAEGKLHLLTDAGFSDEAILDMMKAAYLHLKHKKEVVVLPKVIAERLGRK